MPSTTTKEKGARPAPAERAMTELKKLGDELGRLAKEAKQAYTKADPRTKQAIVAGVSGAVALIAGAIGFKAVKKGRK